MARALRRSILAIGVSAAVLSVSALAFPALAQSSADADNRLRRLENEIQTLSRAVYRGETPEAPPGGFDSGSGQAVANIEVRLTQMESDLRALTGRVEEQSFEVKRLGEQVQRMTADLDARLSVLQSQSVAPVAGTAGTVQSGYAEPSFQAQIPQPPPSYQAPPPGAVPPGPTGGAPALGQMTQGQAGGMAGDDPAALYESAFASVKASDFDGAEKGLEDFLRRYPDHDLAPNAKYWLGETYYVRGDFQQAARVFAEAYKQYPKGPKGPDNLLKLGMSLAGMGSKDDACVALGQIRREYPNGTGPVISRANQEMEKLGCP